MLVSVPITAWAWTTNYHPNNWHPRSYNDYSYPGSHNYNYNYNDNYKETYHYGNDSGHSVASIKRLPNQGFLIVLEDGRVVTVNPQGKVVSDNNKGRLLEKVIPWAAILGIVGIVVH